MFSRWGAIELLLCLLCVFILEPDFSTAQTLNLFDMGFDNPLNSIWNNRQVIGEVQPINRFGCTTNDQNNRDGVCMKTASCRYQGGISTGRGTCGIWNTCCIFETTSNQTSSARVTYFVNPMNARGRGRKQQVHVQLKPEVCQVRVDIKNMNIRIPTPYPNRLMTSRCVQDYLTIEPMSADNTLPNLCGKNKDQHFYVHLDSSHSTFTLTVILDQTTGVTDEATWDIKITQLECPQYRGMFDKKFGTDPNQVVSDIYQLAPRGCLQYFTEQSGEFWNFGFISTADTTLTTGQNYAICFKRQPGSCGIQLTQMHLNLRDSTAAAGTPCDEEYIYIPEQKEKNKEERYCMKGTNIIIESIHPGPLYVSFNSIQRAVTTTVSNPGFKFKFDNARCQ